MQTTLGQLRKMALRRRAWASTGTTFNNHVRDAANQSLTEMSADIPTAIVPHKSHQVFYKQYKSQDEDVSRYLEATADPLVLRFTNLAGNGLGNDGDWTPTIDGSWNGVMWLEVETPDGVWVRHRSMEFYKVAALVASNDEYYVSLDRPWRNTTDDSMNFRIWQEYFYLPSSVTSILAPIRLWGPEKYAVHPMNRQQLLDYSYVEYQGDVTGPPLYFGRANEFEQVPAASTAPTISASGTWVGEAQEGSFRVIITRYRGKTHAKWQDSPAGIAQDPVLESSASPESSTFNHASGSNAGKCLVISFTAIDQQLNFANTGLLRDGHSGYGTRIWIARDSVRTAGLGTSNKVDADGVFYLLADVSGEISSYTWDGSVVPDYRRRLTPSTGYYAWKLYPVLDNDYEADIEGIATPQELVHDQDSPPIHEKFMPAYMNLLLAYLCEMDGGDLAASSHYRRHYDNAIRPARAELANPTGHVVVPPFNTTGIEVGYHYPIRMRILP